MPWRERLNASGVEKGRGELEIAARGVRVLLNRETEGGWGLLNAGEGLETP